MDVLKKIWKGASTSVRWILVVLVMILLGWLAYMFQVNVGGLIHRILGENKDRVTPIIDDEGNQIGVKQPIIIGNDALRDTSVVALADGTEVALPKGVKDLDVVSITKVETDYHVEVKHEKYTSVFD